MNVAVVVILLVALVISILGIVAHLLPKPEPRAGFFPALCLQVADGEVCKLAIREKNRPGERLGPLAGAHVIVKREDYMAPVYQGLVSSAIRTWHGGKPQYFMARGPTVMYLVLTDGTTVRRQVSGVGGRAAAEAVRFNAEASQAELAQCQAGPGEA